MFKEVEDELASLRYKVGILEERSCRLDKEISRLRSALHCRLLALLSVTIVSVTACIVARSIGL